MKPNLVALSPPQQLERVQINKRTAYHLAGHAVAIVLGNKQRQLPEVDFKIIIKEKDLTQPTELLTRKVWYCDADIQGGRLIENLPFSFSEFTQYLSPKECESYKNAFEADIINFLSGPLTEAMYVAFRDDEAFSSNLVNVAALRFYGGASDLSIVSEYMDCLMLNKHDYHHKLRELYTSAYQFLNRQKIWYVVTKLAETIQNSSLTINCDEVNTILEKNLDAYSIKNKIIWYGLDINPSESLSYTMKRKSISLGVK